MKRYADFRRAGFRACDALRAARTVARWAELEACNSVRIVSEPEFDNYFSVYGEPDGYTDIHGRIVSAEEERAEIERMIERDGIWIVRSEYRDENGEWAFADSIGMIIGNPECPIDNPYLIDLMSDAIDAIESPNYSI